jgi:hypothetical protein
MNAPLVARIDDLLRTGLKLAPEGGSEFSGYNAKKQSKYLLWRKNCLDAVSALAERGAGLCAQITGDENGMYFYHSSAQHIVDILGQALEAARSEAEAAETRARAEAAEREEQERREAAAREDAVREQERIEALERARREEEARAEAEAQEQARREAEIRRDQAKEQASREAARKQIEALEAARAQEAAELARQDEALARAREEAEAAAAAHAARLASTQTDGVPKIMLYSLANHVMLKQVEKFFNDLSLDYAVVTHADGIWESLDALSGADAYCAVFLLSDRYHGQELMALGYLAGRYPSAKLCCIHAHTLPLGDLLPGVSRQEFTVSLDEIKPGLIRELKSAGCSITI